MERIENHSSAKGNWLDNKTPFASPKKNLKRSQFAPFVEEEERKKINKKRTRVVV